MDDLQIPIDSDDAIWKQRCSERMEELKNIEFPMCGEFVRKKKFMSCKLYKAVEYGNVDNFIDVLKNECTQWKLRLCDIFGQVTEMRDSLLHVAAEMGRERIVELICDHFPELLIRRNNIRGDTVVHAAVRSKNSKVVKFILSQYGIEKSKHDEMRDKEITREKNEYGNTPLHEAIYSGDVGVVKEILVRDNDVIHCLNKSKLSPLYLAVVSGNVEILKLLSQVPLLSDQPLQLCFGNSPLHAAIRERNPVLIEVILKERPELVYFRIEDGSTCLHYAADIGYVDGFRILLENSLKNLDESAFEGNNKGNLPIHLACKRGYVEVVKEFLEHEWHINPHVLNQKGQNMLHVAAKNGRTNVVRYLLRNPKIDQFVINQKDNDGNTPLHLASINLFPKVLFLITQDKRTNVTLLNNNGLSARGIINMAFKNQFSVRKLLANRVLKEAGVPVKVNDMLRFRQQQPPKTKWNLIDVINTYLVAGTLMVTVTFAAGFTVPGGVYSSDDPNPKNRGMAVLAHKPLFLVFTTFNMVIMYSSVIACGLILLALTFDHKYAARTTSLAGLCLVIALLNVPVAFFAAVRLVVVNNSALTLIVTLIGVPCTAFCLFALCIGFRPIENRHFPFRQLGRFHLWIFIELTNYDDKPRDRLIVDVEETQTDIQQPNGEATQVQDKLKHQIVKPAWMKNNV